MPFSIFSHFKHEKLQPKGKCAAGSYRTIKRGKHRIIICCPKGEYDKAHQVCRVGTKAKTILHPKKER